MPSLFFCLAVRSEVNALGASVVIGETLFGASLLDVGR